MVMKGQKISDRYQIIKSIGEGGMANVYLANDTILDRMVAVKVLRGDLANDEKFVRRFQREALSASSLSHPNIVEVYDVGEDNGEYYIVMEFIEGKHLKSLIKKRGKLPVSEAVDIVMQIADGLSVAHDSYIIHRDIKPQNIMILENGVAKITDFGIAMAMNSTQLTQTNSVMGSVHYLPPEQASGKGSTLQSDIYSMGILLYELLTGKLPFRGENAVEIALKHLKEEIPSIKDEVPNIPQSVENIIIKATAKNPKNRYNDAREMYDDLKTCLDASRINEEKIKLKYHEFDETKAFKPIKEDTDNNKKVNSKKSNKTKSKVNNKTNNKKDKKVKEEKIKNKEKELSVDDEVVIKKITGDDLKKQNKTLIRLAAIFTGLVIAITLVFVIITVSTKTKTIEVPDVTGKSLTEAIRILQDAGFLIADEQEEIASASISVGDVVKTSPNAGTERKKGSEIKIYLSIGDATITIDNYVGKNYLEVKGNLEARGIVVNIEEEVIDEENADKFKNGDVIEQSVEKGMGLKLGESITLTVASVGVTYPDFTDGTYTVSDVEIFCEDNSVNLKIKYVDGEIGGTILEQNREPGSRVAKGSTFTITVVKSLIEEPDEPLDTECEDGLC